jgi:hypothetical protein
MYAEYCAFVDQERSSSLAAWGKSLVGNKSRSSGAIGRDDEMMHSHPSSTELANQSKGKTDLPNLVFKLKLFGKLVSNSLATTNAW